MLALLFLILKIIGGILLAVFLLLVLLILLILFNPIRYRAEANCEKSADTLQASVTFSWLFHLISGKASWQDKELTCRVRILTKKIGSTPQADKKTTEAGSSPKTNGKAKKAGSSPKKAGCDGDTAGKKNAAQSAEEEKKSKIAEEQTEDKKEKPEGIRLQADAEAEIHSSLKGEASNHPEDRQAETKGSSEAKDQSTKAEKGGGKEAQPEAGGKKEEKKEKNEKKKKKKKKKNTSGDKGKAQRRMAGGEEEASSPLKKKAEKLKYTIAKLCDKINALKEKKDEVLAFIARPEHKAAVQRIFRELKRLLKAIVPKKGNADITFGFEDPATTGYALAGISMVYPFAAEHLEITPNFEEKEITAEVYAVGKIRLFYLVRAVVCLVVDKNVRTLYHSVREMTG